MQSINYDDITKIDIKQKSNRQSVAGHTIVYIYTFVESANIRFQTTCQPLRLSQSIDFKQIQNQPSRSIQFGVRISLNLRQLLSFAIRS